MARTKASVGAKVSSGKSSKARCVVAAPSTSNGSGSGRGAAGKSSGGGNPVCPRETPKWQRPITTFFNGAASRPKDSDDDDNEDDGGDVQPQPKAGGSKRNVIESDDEETQDRPTNKELDETIELEPLSGESSHKLEEYYTRSPKGKGVGKRTANKENQDANCDRDAAKREADSDKERQPRRDSAKRELNLESDSETRSSKRVRVSDS